ncbi:amidohydrolase [Marinilabiliaceae bacterium ANBcel2]|nr:amidohydrolase [Marinilabiliaceae bacterium ANBcel2]
MQIALVQFDIVWENRDENLRKLSSLLSNIKKPTDIVILPEMFHSGFSMKPQKVATTMDGPVIEWMKNESGKLNSIIMGSVAIKDQGNYFNRFISAFPDRSLITYNKRHLFRMAGEHNVYESDNKKVILNYDNWRIALFVCYDLRFPVWSRNVEGYDIAIYVANWPAVRQDAWKTLLKARAIENQCYVIGVNRVGFGNGIEYSGGSSVFNYKGELISEEDNGQEQVIKTSLDFDALKKFREKFPVWKDADRFDLL